MSKYKRKEENVEAIQWFGAFHHPIDAWIKEAFNNRNLVREGESYFYLRFGGGRVEVVRLGNFVVRHEDRISIMDEVLFHEIYEEVSSDE